MELALRPIVTTGVALTTAGLVAVAPLAPPPNPELHASAPPVVSEAVHLVVDPIAAY